MPARHLDESCHVVSSEDSLALLPNILAIVQEIHGLLSTRFKSHYTVGELSEQVGRSEYTVRRWIQDGVIDAVRIDGTGPKGRLLIPRGEIQKLLDRARGSRIPAVQIEQSGREIAREA